MKMCQTGRSKLSSKLGSKLGAAVLATFRLENAKKLFDSIDADEKIVVRNNVGLEYGLLRKSKDLLEVSSDIIAVSRNEAVKELLKRGCTDVILLEDDVEALQPNACRTYADVLRSYGIGHAMLGVCFPGEKPLCTYEGLAFFGNCHGAVTYFTSEAILQCGLCDERFQNALDHVEMTYRLAKAGFTSPFGTYCDIAGSEKLFKHNDGGKTSILHTQLYQKRLELAFLLFKEKHGFEVKDVNRPCKEALEAWLAGLKRSI